MLTVSEALQKVLTNTHRTPVVRVPLQDSPDLVLAEDIASDVDSPPHDKAMVDGYAVVAADLASGAAELSILEEVTTGAVPTKAVSSGQCTRIMTGAPLPAGADAVAMVEYTEVFDNGARVRIVGSLKPRQNIMPRGESLQKGEVVLSAGHLIRPAEIGLLAEVGRGEVAVYGQARVAILSTGNELVEAHEQPAAGQIRNSNGPLLAAAVRRAGGIPIELGIARDNVADLRSKIEQGLTADVLVLSGGVSAGVLDLVPRVLQELGVEQVFHKVNLKPGKPLWFGVHGPTSNVHRSSEAASAPESHNGPWTTDHGRCLVFGVPGNPVSSFVCFELFARPAIAKLTDRDPDSLFRRLMAQLAGEFIHRGDRPTYFPAVVRNEEGGLIAEPVRWRGSADLRGITRANALIAFPAGDRTWQAGDVFEVVLL